MTTLSLNAVRRRAHPVGNAITALALALIAVSLLSLGTGSERSAFAAGTLTGAVTFSDTTGPITAGDSTAFSMILPPLAACQGGGSLGYRWETFLVAAGVDVGALTFGSGPNAVAGSFVSAMYSADGDPVSTEFPGASPLGIISGIPQMSFPSIPTSLPLGDYKIGVACQLNGAIQEYWSTAITITANTADVPLGIAWAVNNSTVVTTTTVAATTTTGAVTTTTGGSTATTTTVRGATTTSTTSTSTTVASTVLPTSTLFGSGATPTTPRSPVLAATGGAPLPLLVWAILLLALGRIVVLLGRPPRVLPPRT